MNRRRAGSTVPRPTRLVYVHALVDSRLPTLRVRGHVIRTIPVAGMFAAVERLDDAPRISEEALRTQHAIVVRLGRNTNAVLPARYGAFMPEDELFRVVRQRRGVLLEALALVRGKQQMTVRILGRRRTGARRDAPVKEASGTAYLRARVESVVGSSSPAVDVIRQAVRPLVSAERIEAGAGAIHATITHLVARGRAPRYRALVKAACAKAERLPQISISGPWPPFAFVPELWP
jgi:hypothetical protein